MSVGLWAWLRSQIGGTAPPVVIQKPVSEEELRGLLQPDEALLSVFAAPDGSYGFLLERVGTLA